jgi:hypothetical protein
MKKIMKYFLFFVVCPTVLFVACSKDNDKRAIFVGIYRNAMGEVKYVFDGFGQYKEAFDRDTASFAIEKINKSDSADYIYLTGVTLHDVFVFGGYYHTLKFTGNGIKIAALATDTSFSVPIQYPYSGGGLSIEGVGSVKNGKLKLTYHTSYRGFHKYATVEK